MVEPKYKRILIKLSGEALAGEKGVGIDIQTVQKMAEEIKEVHDLGVQIALVIGGGNLWRASQGIPIFSLNLRILSNKISVPAFSKVISLYFLSYN